MNAERKDSMKEQKPEVPEKAKQVSEVRSRWEWAESSVWTNRMLEALEKGIDGVKETKWFSLLDKAGKPEALMSAYMKTARNKGAAGVDNVTVPRFAKNLNKHLDRMREQMLEGEYYPSPVRRSYIDKAGAKEKRPLGIPTVRDRIAQTAVRYAMEPIFENEFAESSYGFRPGKGCKDALREVDNSLKKGFRYVVDADLRKCFDNIPHDRLLERIEEKVADGKLLELVRRFLKQSIMEDGVAKGPEEEGTPQGATLSPLLCNIYLNPLDHLMENAGLRMIRYADDLVVLCHTAEEAEHAMELLEKWTVANGLELHPEKTDTVDMAELGSHFDFLGYRFKRTRKGKLDRFPSPKSEKRFRQKLQRETKRNNGRSLEEIVRRCNRIIRGWFEYFKHASKWSLRSLDRWVRMRLRSILRKRSNRRGRGRGGDHQRWPNAYFANAGLFSMYAAWQEASSPQRG